MNFQAGREQTVTTAGMSNAGGSQPVCKLPYETTHVEVEVLDSTGAPVVQQQFAVAYRFVAAP